MTIRLLFFPRPPFFPAWLCLRIEGAVAGVVAVVVAAAIFLATALVVGRTWSAGLIVVREISIGFIVVVIIIIERDGRIHGFVCGCNDGIEGP